MKKISIIVPVYNVEEYLEKCLNSLINQTLEDIEIIVVNDGSMDNSYRIIDECAKKTNKIISYKKENGGLASARNFGIHKATGKYIIFVDSDDFVEKNMCEDMYNKMISKDYDIVVSDFYEERNEKTFIRCGLKVAVDQQKAFMISYPAAWNKIYKTSFLIQNNFEYFENHYYEDIASTPALAALTDKIGYINKPYYHYLIREGSIMNQTKMNPKMLHIFDSMQNLSNKMKELKKYDYFKSEMEMLYIMNLLHGASLRFMKFPDTQDYLDKIVKVLDDEFKDWKKNIYFKKMDFKFKVMCDLLYKKRYSLIKLITKKE